MLTKYAWLKLKIILSLISKKKITFTKIFNAFHCYAAYYLRLDRSATTPFLINFELSNYCNENCVFCRTENGRIYDLNPDRKSNFIERGIMQLEIFEAIIKQTKDTLLMAVPYVNGEPFIYKELGRAIRIATENNVASMIATNGLLLNEKNINTILDNGLDFIKVHVSGFSRKIHRIQHRVGDIELIKNNLKLLSRIIMERNVLLIVMVDYILYMHNAHEVELFRKFAKDLGFMFSIRSGNPHGMEGREEKQHKGGLPVGVPCDWLWKVLTINWNGDILPCCDYVTWSGVKGYGRFFTNNTNLSNIWNGTDAVNMRRVHRKQGRAPIPICSKCPRMGVEFKF